MANTKVTSRVIADNAVGITQLNVSDGSDGQALTTNGSGTLSFATISAGVAGISSSADATAITITSDENVGIGTASPSTPLHVESSTSNENTAFIRNTAGTGVNYGLEIRAGTNATDHALQVLDSGGTSRLRVTGAGNVGIGTASPSAKLHSEGSFSGQIGYFNQTGSGGGNHGVYIDCASTGGWTFLARNGGSARFGITGTEARIFNGVTFQSGTSTSDKGGHIRTWAGSGYIGLTGDLTGYSAGTYSTLKANGSYIYFDISQTYSAYMSSNGTLNANSDRRLKENIETLSTGQLDKVCNLRGVNFDWIDQRVTGNQVGLIAQEVQEEYPELVGDGGVEDGTLTVNYAGLVSPLIEAIKELKTKLEAAEARITELEG